MKVHIITDEHGDIVATVHGAHGSHGDAPVPQPQPLPGQKIHHIELPKNLVGLRDAESLHRELKKHLG